MSQATQSDTTNPSRRALLAGAPAVAAAALAGGTVTNALAIAEAKVDPIFAVIAEHRGALAALAAAFAQDADQEDRDELINAASDRETEVELTLWTTAPTTLDGAVALLAYAGETGPSRGDETMLQFAHEWVGDDLRSAVQGFPLRLADTLRSLIAEARS